MNRKEAINRIQEVMTIIRTQHMCKDMDGIEYEIPVDVLSKYRI